MSFDIQIYTSGRAENGTGLNVMYFQIHQNIFTLDIDFTIITDEQKNRRIKGCG